MDKFIDVHIKFQFIDMQRLCWHAVSLKIL